jgi:hypothetical protein
MCSPDFELGAGGQAPTARCGQHAAIKRHVAGVRHEGQGTISFFYYSSHGAAAPDTKINYLISVEIANADDESAFAR